MTSSSGTIRFIKLIHTLIWIFYNVVIFYMLYVVLADEISLLFWIGWGFIFLEGLILLMFRWTCPLTIIARNHTDSTDDNFDIYLPNWLAKHTKTIYTGITVLIALLNIYRVS
ncbi:hypothetical protein SYJ56_21575 [Algoriphagus sp. D3-2-R+10]|uniref:hypothetical protein n=1 Tax=Algoriphagus aurantiacus TaxID=3103948 RepID=UPI002B3A7574|nr:hypothetical protein [Algoriphagus sp. D3-2-R+10]MEB2777919.1 hypothetical protein [Algoriphagus sp. D3-2-R+10]